MCKNLLDDSNLDSSLLIYLSQKFLAKKNTFIKLNKKKFSYLRDRSEILLLRGFRVVLASRYYLIKKGLRIGKRVKIEKYKSFHGLIDIHDKKDIKLSSALLNKRLLD